MKFWQKAFFITMILFLLAFDAMGYILLERSFALNREYAIQAAQTEHMIIWQSAYERIKQLSVYYTELNPENLKGMILPYTNYYAGQNTYIALYQNGTEVINSNPFFLPPAANGEEARMYETAEGLFCVVESELSELSPHDGLRFVYMKDASSLLRFKNDMIRGFIALNVIISLILSVILLFLLVRLTHPFRKLGAAAESIARGDYGNRAPERGNDEIGQFARSFNMMADKVREHIDALSYMNESRERFINNLAHETRTPITAVLGYAELLKIGNINDEEREKSIDYIISQSRRIQGMAGKLTDLARMSNGNIEKRPIDIPEIISNAQATCKALLDEKQITLNKVLQTVNITGDAGLLESLLQNLIENAAKYSENRSEIDIQAYSENDGAVLTVTDYGKGMEESEISKITEPFYRIDKSRSRIDGGIGLGLSLCVRICEIHNARLEIESETGKGTKINIYFTT